jgi:hypothetical protein
MALRVVAALCGLGGFLLLRRSVLAGVLIGELVMLLGTSLWS